MAKRSPEDDNDVIITSENRENGSYDPDNEDMAPSDNDNNNNNDEDDDMNQNDNNKKKKKKKKKRVRVMAGQTDNDRRVLRRRQRELHNDITMDVPAAEGGGARGGGGGNNDNDDDSSDDEQQQQQNNKKKSPSGGNGGGVLSWREKNNALWDDVRYTREAVLDSENLDIITSKAAREVEKIVQVSTYNYIYIVMVHDDQQ